MADIDREKFAYAVAAELDAQDLSFAAATAKYKGVHKGLLSRVRNGHPVSAENMLTLCHHLGLDPFDYLDLDRRNTRSHFGRSGKQKSERFQGVSVDKRETCHRSLSDVVEGLNR